MSARKTAQIRSSLLEKGFRSVDTHHEVFWLWVAGKKTSVHTYMSQGARECGDSLLGQMARQVGLKRTEFDDLVDCPLTGEAYLAHLVEMGKVRI